MGCKIEVPIRRQERLAVIPTLTYVALEDVPIPATAYEASIDHGVTWETATESPHGLPMWTVAAPEYPGPGDNSDTGLTQFTLPVTPGRTDFWVRLIDSPVTEIADDIQLVLIG